MNIESIMTRDVASCGPDDTLARAAQLMWERDCGFVPIVSEHGFVVGIVTDRDACMAAFTKARRLDEILTRDVMSSPVESVTTTESIEATEAKMRRYRIRRIPVVDAEGKLRGVISLNDIVRHVEAERDDGLGPEALAVTLAQISEPRILA